MMGPPSGTSVTKWTVAPLVRAPDVGAVAGRIVVPLPDGRRPTDWERSTAGLQDARWATADMAYPADLANGSAPEAEEFDPVGLHRLAEGRLEAGGGRERAVIHHHRRDAARAGALEGKRVRHVADDDHHLSRDRAAAAAVDDGLEV